MAGVTRRWTQDILAAFAPEGGRGLAPLPGEVDYLGTFARMRREATHKAALGLWAAVMLVSFAPPLLGHGLRLFSHLRAPDRTRVLERLLGHRSFAVRELTLLLKFAAAMALLGHDGVRERSGYDQAQRAEELESGVRRRLPVLDSAADDPGAPLPAGEEYP